MAVLRNGIQIADDDPATDESFEYIGDGSWDVGAALEGVGSPLISWPSDQDLPFSLSCVGIDGTLEAVDLGGTELSISPSEWNSGARTMNVIGPEGSFRFQYSITQVEGPPRAEPMVLDIEMSFPINVHLDDRRIFTPLGLRGKRG